MSQHDREFGFGLTPGYNGIFSLLDMAAVAGSNVLATPVSVQVRDETTGEVEVWDGER